MNNRMIEDFAQRYNAKVMIDEPDRRYGQGRGYSRYDSYSVASGPMSATSKSHYYDPYSRVVDIEMPMRSLDDLLRHQQQADTDYQASKEEAHIRRQFPAVAEAYAQYKMLLELCR